MPQPKSKPKLKLKPKTDEEFLANMGRAMMGTHLASKSSAGVPKQANPVNRPLFTEDTPDRWEDFTPAQKVEFLHDKIRNNYRLKSGNRVYSKANIDDINIHTHWKTLSALYQNYETQVFDTTLAKMSKGHGHGLPVQGRIRGRGMRSFKNNREKIEHRIEGEFVKPKPYKQFGRYLINRDKLMQNIVMIKRPAGAPAMPTEKVSPELGAVLRSLVRAEDAASLPNMEQLSDSDIQKLAEITEKCCCTNIPVPTPKLKTDDEKEMDKFNILRGEILAGNDNKDLVKEFKLMLVRFMNSGRIPRRQAQEILTDIASMGL